MFSIRVPYGTKPRKPLTWPAFGSAPNRSAGSRVLQASTVLIATLLAILDPATAGTVVSGKSAQALRCAAYIGMAARIGHDEGYLSAHDAEAMTWWSVQVLDRWVPLPTEERIAAYGATLGELGTRERTYGLIARHTDWCVRAFSPIPEGKAAARPSIA